MPRFSVIVPAHQVQAHLSGCLESVLSQSYTDLELIVVDDGSPDACGELADEFAARDARVRPVHLARSRGLGPARNAGLDRALGDYLLFLDGGDTLAPHALRALADRVKDAGEPDVLVHGFARTRWSGEAVRDSSAPRLAAQGRAPFRPEDRPGLLHAPAAPWTRAWRREFVERQGLAFPPGDHGDVAWTFPLLMAAESIAVLDGVCVRRRPSHAVDGPGDRRPTGVFAQYERVFGFLAGRSDLAAWRPVLFRRMVDDVASLLAGPLRDGPGATGRRARSEFLRAARTHYRRHRAAAGRLPLRARPRHTLVRFGLHRTYRVLRACAAGRRRAAKAAARLARSVRATALRLHYRVQRCLPLRADRAVFASSWGGGHGCQPGALEQAFRLHAPQVRTAWVAGPAHRGTVPEGTRRLVPGTAAYWTALARSRYLVDNAGFDGRLVRRPGQVVVQTGHGTPLKHMGLDLLERPAAGRSADVAELLRDAGRWDWMLSANRHTTLTWERVHPGRYTTLEYGSPRNDVFQQATSADVTRIREALGVPAGTVAILYAPTYRDYRRTQRPHLDLERVVHDLGPDFVVLARPHPVHGGPAVPGSGRVIDVSAHPRVQELCLASDALVTDYSSLMFDYANLDRPIVVHTEDWAAYRAARGTYFDLRSFPPGAVARSEDELVDIFTSGHWRGSRSAQLRAAFRERFCPYDDGRAAERVVRRLVFGEEGLPPVIPPAERHPVPSAAESARGRAPVAGRATAPAVPRPAVPRPTGPGPVAGPVAGPLAGSAAERR
ncbi:CDP-glycerol glycerophosphotransferase family protein [Streptomyces sp. MS06]|uniref:bifunctional glycosyltransferase/CDP-glycerol:glycerophosphate glycerophosphotransferase n=1 Tax=Streptomyces sp. MS06 TaxID=3385974 RepID=UPI0039A263C8